MAIKTVQAICNNVTSNLTYNATTKMYEGNITAPGSSSYPKAGHYYPVTLIATDDAGNVTTIDATHATLGTALRLIVKEKVVPLCAFTTPASGALLKSVRPTITWTCTDADSGVNPDTIRLFIDSTTITTGIAKTAITGGYQCAYTPTTDLTQGSHTVKIDCSDFDGNVAVQQSRSFICDTITPTLVISTPTNNLVTKTASCTVSGTATDVTTNPCTVTLKHNSGTAVPVTVSDNGAWSKVITLVEGVNTIEVVATDRAGNTVTLTRTVTLDTRAPVFETPVMTPNPVTTGSTFKISVKVSD